LRHGRPAGRASTQARQLLLQKAQRSRRIQATVRAAERRRLSIPCWGLGFPCRRSSRRHSSASLGPMKAMTLCYEVVLPSPLGYRFSMIFPGSTKSRLFARHITHHLDYERKKNVTNGGFPCMDLRRLEESHCNVLCVLFSSMPFVSLLFQHANLV
jgi:hypothetical protein